MWGILKAAGLALALANLKQRIRGLAVKGMLAAAGALVLGVAICFFLVALHAWLSGLLNPIASAAIIGGVLVVVGGILLYLASRPTAVASSVVPQLPGRGGDTNWSQLAQGFTSGGSPLASPVFQAAILALAAGYFLGRKRPDRDERDDD